MHDTSLTQNKGLSLLLGILLIILGVIALGSQIFLTFASVVFFGWFLIIGGIFEFIYGFFSGSLASLFLAIMGGVLSFFVGALMVTNPGLSAATITFLLATIFLVGGGYKVISALFTREDNWGASLVAGIVIFSLGFLVLVHWPVSSLRLIGFFIGAEILINGFIFTSRVFQHGDQVEVRHVGYVSGVKGGKAENKKSER